jgi:RNA polymerase sigma-70 factor, ECF subfamily
MERAQAADDDGLLERARGGDMAAFEALVARYRDRVFSLAFRMTGSEADAAEVAQETFLSAYQHLKDFRGEAAFGSWVHRIAANHALMRLRRARVDGSKQAEPAEPTFNQWGSHEEYPQRDWSRDAEGQVLDAELREAIGQATDRLPLDYRQVFILKDVEGLSYEEIAELTGESVAAIKSRLHRARLALRTTIDKFYNNAG